MSKRNDTNPKHLWSGLIPLSEAAQFTPYSAEYLGLLARRKKLPAKKIRGVWYTTRQFVENYMQTQMERVNGNETHRETNPSTRAELGTGRGTEHGAERTQNVQEAREINERELEPEHTEEADKAPSSASSLRGGDAEQVGEAIRRTGDDPVNDSLSAARGTAQADAGEASTGLPRRASGAPHNDEISDEPHGVNILSPRGDDEAPRAARHRFDPFDTPLSERTLYRRKNRPEHEQPAEPLLEAKPQEGQRNSFNAGGIGSTSATNDLPELFTMKRTPAYRTGALPEASIAEMQEERARKQGGRTNAHVHGTQTDGHADDLFEQFIGRFITFLDNSIEDHFGILHRMWRVVRNAFAAVFAHQKIFTAFLILLLIFTLLPFRVVSGFFDTAYQKTINSLKDAQTVMGFRPGTHANEILLLDPEGSISIFGDVETEGQFASFAEDGIAPIRVRSTTKVKNLNADYLDNLSAEEFTLAFVTKNGNVTRENVYLEGGVEVGKTLLVKGATKLLQTLEVHGNLETLGSARIHKSLTVSGDAHFKALVSAARADISGAASVGGQFSVGGNARFDSFARFDGGLGATNGSFKDSLGVGGDFSVGGDAEFRGSLTGKDSGSGDTTWSIGNSGGASFKTLSVSGEASAGSLSVGGDTTIGGNTTITGSLTNYGDITAPNITATSTISISKTDSASSSAPALFTIEHLSSGTGGQDGIGSAILFKAEDSGGTSTSTGRILSVFNETSSTSPQAYLAFETKGRAGTTTEQLRITATGNVGIGTTSPYATLSVVGPVVAEYFHATSTATSTFRGPILAQGTPGSAHSFGTWAVDAAGSAAESSSFLVNPASATADSNLIAAAVAGSAKFLVDAEGDVFANSLTTEGSVNVGNTTVSTLVVEGSSTLGDSSADRITPVARFNYDIVPAADDTYNIGTSSPSLTWNTGYFGEYLTVGSTTPWANLAVHRKATATNFSAPLFRVSSSTASYATSTLFTIEQTGNVLIAQEGDGQVGIGTTTPSAKLAVSGGAFFDGATTTQASISATSSAQFSFLTSGSVPFLGASGFVKEDAANFTWDASANVLSVSGLLANTASSTITNLTSVNSTSTNATSTNAHAFSFLTSGSVPFIGTGGTLKEDNSNLFWDSTNARLGIGTTSPTALLNVRGGDRPQFILTDPNGAADQKHVYASSTNGALAFGELNDNLDTFTERMRIDKDGNVLIAQEGDGQVGIGTTNPLEKMDVRGTITAPNNKIAANFFCDRYGKNCYDPHLNGWTRLGGDGNADSTVKIASGTNGGPTLTDSDLFGISAAGIGDLNGDGVPDMAVGAPHDDTGGFNSNRGAAYVTFMNTDGTVSSSVKIASGTNGGPTLTDGDNFGISAAGIGDLNGDGVPDMAVGAYGDDTGGTSRGAAYVLFMNTDGTVSSSVKIASGTNGGPTLTDGDLFGISAAGIGDLNGDGVPDMAAGAYGDDTGGSNRGAAYVTFMNTDGTVSSSVKIASGTNGGPTLTDGDNFGDSAAGIGDLNGDGVPDMAVGARLDDTGGSNRGAAYVTFMAKDNIHFAGQNVGIGTTTPSAKLAVSGGAFFDGATTTQAGISATSSAQFSFLTSGSVPFIGTGGTLKEDNSNLFWDSTNTRLGIGSTDPSTALDVQGTASSTDVRVDSLASTGVPITANGSKNLTSSSTLRDFVIDDALTISASGSVADGALSANVSLLGQTISEDEFANTDFGEFACDGTDLGCTLDNGALDDQYLVNDANDTTTGQLTIEGGVLVNNSTSTITNLTSVNSTSTNATSTNAHAFSFLTSGSVPFIGTGGTLKEDNSNLFWDSTNARLGIGTTTPGTKLQVNPFSNTVGLTASWGSMFIDGEDYAIDSADGTQRGTLDIGMVDNGGVDKGPTLTFSLDGNKYSDDAPTVGGGIKVASEGDVNDNNVADNYMAFYTSSSANGMAENVRIDSNGNVGIGTTTPDEILQLASTADTRLMLSDTDAAVDGKHWWIESNAQDFSIGTTTDNLGTDQTYLTIAEGGNMGIGAASPYSKLHLEDDTDNSATDIRTYAGGFDISNKGSAGAYALMRMIPWDGEVSVASSDGNYIQSIGNANNDVDLAFGRFDSAGTITEIMRLDNSGNVGIGTTTPDEILQLASTANTRLMLSDTNAAVDGKHWWIESNAQDFSIGTTTDNLGTDQTYLTIAEGGNVGIGTTGPDSTFHVVSEGVFGDDGVSAQQVKIEGSRTDAVSTSDNYAGIFTTSGGTDWTGGDRGDLFIHPRLDTARDIRFYGYNGGSPDELVRIDDDGDVGIGNVSPSQKLHIEDSSSGAKTSPLVLDNRFNVDSTEVAIAFSPFSTDTITGDISVFNAKNRAAGTYDMKFSTWNGSALEERMVIYGQDGNVGIGSSTPSTILSIESSGGNPDVSLSGGASIIQLGYDPDTGPHGFAFADDDSNGAQLLFRTATNRLLIESANDLSDGTDEFFYDVDADEFFLGGDVGIGTTSPISILSLGVSDVDVDNFLTIARGGLSDGGIQWDRQGTIDAQIYMDANEDLRISNDFGGDIVLENGNVGIGTDAPESVFDIDGSADSSIFQLDVVGTRQWDWTIDSDGNLDITNSGGSSGTITFQDSPTAVGIGTTTPFGALAVEDLGSAGGTTPGLNVVSDHLEVARIIGEPEGGANQTGLIVATDGDSGDIIADFRSDATNGGLPLDSSDSKMIITGPGDVGIGDTAPSGVLQVQRSHGSGTTQEIFRTNFDDNWGLRLVQNYVGAGDIKYEWKEEYNNVEYDVLAFQAGNVGIGETSPGAKLDVAAANAIAETDDAEGTIARFDDSFYYGTNRNMLEIKSRRHSATTTGASPWENSALRLEGSIDSNATANSWIEFMHFDSTGNNAISFGEGDGDATEWMRIDNGDVGIGTVSPNNKLHTISNAAGLSFPLQIGNTQDNIVDYGAGILFQTGTGGNTRGKGALAYVYDSTATWNRGDFHFLQNSAADATNPTLSNSVLTIKNNGNVGIGTTTPDSKFVVNTGTGGAGNGLKVEGTVEPALRLRNYDYRTYDIFSGGGGSATYDNLLTFYDRATGNNFVFEGSTGNVGIGTANPATNNRLHVSDGSATGVTTGTIGSILVTDDTAPRIVFENAGEGLGDKIMIAEYTSENISFGSALDDVTNWDVRDIMVINRDGNVGIGTTTPNENLDVDGAIFANDGVIRNYEHTDYAKLDGKLVYRRYSHSSGHPTTTEGLTDLIKGASFVSQGVTANISGFSFGADNYAVEFVGYFYADSSGTYTFGVNSDDASDLFIDGKLVAYWYDGHGTNTSPTPGGTQLTAYLEKGYHRLYTRFEEGGGGDSHEIVYKTPGSGTWATIPSSVLFHHPNDLLMGSGDDLTVMSGNVGIGTVSPSALLNVDKSQDGQIADFHVVKNDGGSNDAVYILDDRGFSGNNSGTTFKIRSRTDDGTNTGALVNFETFTGVTAKSRFYIDSSNGNVGVGTTTPGGKLHVDDTSLSNVTTTMGAAAAAIITSEGGELAFGLEDTSPWPYFIQARYTGDIARNLAINPEGGNVGIGDTSPTYDLDVTGDINFTGKLREDGVEIFSDMIAAFPNTCPTGWSEYTTARGRYLVGTPLSGTDEATVGTALSDKQNRAVGQHNHGITDPGHNHADVHSNVLSGGSFTRPNVANTFNVQIGAGGAGGYVSSNTTGITINNTGSVAGTNAPYVQVTFCQKTAGADYAEWIDAYGGAGAGDIVAIDPDHPKRVTKATESLEHSIAGAVSTQPGWLIGTKSSESVALALAGRIPVKVNHEGGIIKPGDRITISSVPGVGKKATENGYTVGIALEGWNSAGEQGVILALIAPQYYFTDGDAFVENYDGRAVTAAQTTIKEVAARYGLSGDAPTSTPSIYIAEDGSVGIGTTTPEYDVHIAGEVAANSFVNVSTRDTKKDITPIRITNNTNTANGTSFLEKIKNLELFTYRYRYAAEDAPKRLGLIAEESPEEVLSADGKGVDLYKLITFVTGGVKELIAKVDKVTDEITKLYENYEKLTERIAALEEALQTGANTVNDTIAGGVASLQELGVSIKDGVITAVKIVVEQTTTQALTVGSPEKQAGITLYDENTGEPYCLKIKGGKTVSTPGTCSGDFGSPQDDATPPVIEIIGNPATTSSQSSDGYGAGNPATDETSPTISIIGNNPAYIAIGTNYSDLGATVTDNMQENIGYNTNLRMYTSATNGYEWSEWKQVKNVSIDTSTSTTYEIAYTAEDQAGNRATSTRTVIVGKTQSTNGGTLTSTSTTPTAEPTTATSTPSSTTAETATSTEPTTSTFESLNSLTETTATPLEPTGATSTLPQTGQAATTTGSNFNETESTVGTSSATSTN